jgi:predicted MFS family arabinose efflux permease
MSHGGSEFRRDRAWRVVLAAGIGCALGLTALPFYTIGVFAQPLTDEFGWSRAVVQAAVSCALLGVLCSAWAAGWLIDRIGVRRVALGSQIGLALCFLALPFQTGNPWLWYANWFIMAILGVGTTPLSWSRGIGGWFDKQRGLALGLALTGTGVTAFAAPLVLTPLIAAQGWRFAYAAIGLAILVVALPIVWAFFRERPVVQNDAHQPLSAHGLTLRQAVHGRQFWLILVSFALVTCAVAGTISNLVPMLTDAGIDPLEAAGYASIVGLNVMLGRLLAGWLLDRMWAPLVAIIMLTPPALACVMLTMHQWPLLAAALVGLAGGAEFDLIAYLCLRYFGTRHFGQIYAWQWAAFSAASAMGPIGFGLIYDQSRSYDGALLLSTALILAGPLLLLALGRYPAPDQQANSPALRRRA